MYPSGRGFPSRRASTCGTHLLCHKVDKFGPPPIWGQTLSCNSPHCLLLCWDMVHYFPYSCLPPATPKIHDCHPSLCPHFQGHYHMQAITPKQNAWLLGAFMHMSSTMCTLQHQTCRGFTFCALLSRCPILYTSFISHPFVQI